MAAGRTHDLVNLAVLPVAVYYLQPENFAGFVAGYLAGTFFLSPDNDIYHSKPNRRWKYLRIIWLPYTKLFSHRGISHIPVVGSITKIIYLLTVFTALGVLLAGVIYLYDKQLFEKLVNGYINGLTTETVIGILKHPYTVSFAVGLILSEIVHVATDMVYSTAKKLRLLR
ncbi:metal-binding protein [Persephonella sp.]